ncbi:MAG TPA: tetratricopeptide repeat protein, partial [Candidatus Tectomicrobia bacterium]|nr:tetratricopeptide repeat protein [Candidatus Tectomicrobia bacterium]
AEPLFREGLAIVEAAHGPDSAALAPYVRDHAAVLRRLGRAAEAEPIEDRAMALRRAGARR